MEEKAQSAGIRYANPEDDILLCDPRADFVGMPSLHVGIREWVEAIHALPEQVP